MPGERPPRPSSRFESSALPYVLGIAAWLAVLALRDPRLFTEPTIYGDELAWTCLQRGAGGSLVPRYFGTVNLVPMLENWVLANHLPFHSLPAAWSLASLGVSAASFALLLHPHAAGWLPLWPERVLVFGLFALLPFQGLAPVATLPLQHLSFFFVAFLVLVTALATTEPRLGDSARALVGRGVVFAVAVASAPMTPVLLPIPLAVLLASRGARDARRPFAALASAVLAVQAAWEMSTSGGLPAMRDGAGRLLWLWARLYGDRVVFEPLFGLSSKIALFHAHAYVLVYAVGLAGVAFVGATVPALPPARRFVATSALYASIAAVGFSLLGRYELSEGVATWHHGDYRLAIPEASLKFANARYFLPSAALFLVALGSCFAPGWATLVSRRRVATLGVAAWLAALNYFENVRYEEPVAPLLAARPHARTLRSLAHGGKADTTRRTMAVLSDLDAAERALPPGRTTRVRIPGEDCDVELRAPR